MYEISVRSEFSGAHRLIDYHGKCEELHGHNWKVEVVVSATQLNKEGMVMDFKVLKRNLEIVINRLDHRFLNNLTFFKGINPTSENIAKFIHTSLKERLKKSSLYKLKVIVWEKEDSSATYYEE